VRGLASAAAPFRPASDWPALRIRLASSDLHAVWEALDAAGYLGGDQIAEELFDRVGTGHPSAGLRAACALELSIGRLAPGMRARLLARLGERLRLRANPLDECLRRGLLAELAGDVAGALAGYDRCRASGDGETLAATLATRLSLRARRDDGGQRVHGLAAVLSRQAETASKLFPTPLVPEQSDLGRLAARQLAGVVALAEGVLGSSARRDSAYDEGLSSPLLRVRAEGLARLKDLERQVLEIDPTFVAARERRVAPEAAAHRVARQGAWERLLELARRGDLLGRAAVGGLCRLGAAPVPCASVVGM
jgi:hypothetical protein